MPATEWNEYIARVLAPALPAYEQKGALPDVFARYGLSPDEENPAVLTQTAAAVEMMWNKYRRQNPKYEKLVTVLLGEHRQALATLQDPARRKAERAAERARAAEELGELDKMVRLIEQRGYARDEDITKLGAQFGRKFEPALIRARFKVPIIPPLAALTARRMRDEQYAEVRSNLAVLQQQSFYSLLGLQPGTPPDQIRARIERLGAERRRMARNEQEEALGRLLASAGYLTDGSPSSYDGSRYAEAAEKVRSRADVLPGTSAKRLTREELGALESAALRSGLTHAEVQRVVFAVLADLNVAVDPPAAKVPNPQTDSAAHQPPGPAPQPVRPTPEPIPPGGRARLRYYVRSAGTWYAELFERNPQQGLILAGLLILSAILVLKLLIALVGSVLGWAVKMILAWVFMWLGCHAALWICWRSRLARVTSPGTLDIYVRRSGDPSMPTYQPNPERLAHYASESGARGDAFNYVLVLEASLVIAMHLGPMVTAGAVLSIGGLGADLLAVGVAAALFRQKTLSRIDVVPSLARAIRRRHEELSRPASAPLRLPWRPRTVGIGVGVAAVSVAGASWAYAALLAPRLQLKNEFYAPARITLATGETRVLAPGEETTLTAGGAGAFPARWETVPPVGSDGRALGGVVQGILVAPSGFGAAKQVLGPIGPGYRYFAAFITNNTPSTITIEVNPDAVDQSGRPLPHCRCPIPAGARRVPIGYYQLGRNSAVRATDSQGHSATFTGLLPRMNRTRPAVSLVFNARDFQ